MTTTDRTHDVESRPGVGHGPGHSGHSWMMIACCIPMILIAVALVITGVVSPGFLFVAIACTAMMALMMRGMDHGDEDERSHGGHRPGER